MTTNVERYQRIAPLYDFLDGPFERTGATGDPTRATAFKGERLLAARVDDIVAAIAKRWPAPNAK